MSNLFEWTQKDYGLDVFEMDNEHKVLIQKMNSLHRSYVAHEPFPELKKKIDDLAKYTVEHFQDEEAYMEKIGFPGVVTHKIIHQQLLKQFGEFVAKAEAAQSIGNDFFGFLKVWLSAHIRGIDMKYANHSKQSKAS